MKAIRADLPQDVDKIEIHPLADLHIGDMSCEYKRILEEIKYIRETPNCYCVLDGDLMDTAIASSIGDTYAASHTPMQQIQECMKIFEPIKHKILAVCGGNHENRVYKSDGIDMTQIMCNQLGIGEKYSSTTVLLYIRSGFSQKRRRPYVYSMYMTHGSGGGRKEGGKINRLADLAQIVDADIYLMGHVHQPAVLRNDFFRTTINNSSVEKVPHLFVNTAAWLDYGGYGDKQGYKPASTINPVIWLSGTEKKCWAVL